MDHLGSRGQDELEHAGDLLREMSVKEKGEVAGNGRASLQTVNASLTPVTGERELGRKSLRQQCISARPTGAPELRGCLLVAACVKQDGPVLYPYCTAQPLAGSSLGDTNGEVGP